MDRIKALELEKEIKGIKLDGFEIIEFINNGKSAAVFKAIKNGENYAVKIFDNELIERFGHEIQVKRIQQEISLMGHEIDNLVKIHQGGKATFSDQNYYYIVMEYIEGKNLMQFIRSENYTIDFTLYVLETLINTTEKLLDQKQIAHRDIKPENIMVRQDGIIILMDLGVLKLIGAKSFSDEEEKSFVGTLRYAAPEFLRRTEEDSINGWRALNQYQIGATIHDLITKRELFWDKIPYTNLVIAIKDDIPPINNNDYPFRIQQLIRDMLSKDWKKRLELITIQRIKESINSIRNEDTLDKSIDTVLKMRMVHIAKFDEIEKLRKTNEEIRNKQKEVAQSINNAIEQSFIILKDKGIFATFKKSTNFNFAQYKKNPQLITQNYLYELQGDLRSGYIRSLFILVQINNDDANFTEISLWAIFPSIFRKANVMDPIELFRGLNKINSIHRNTQTGINSLNQGPVPFNFKTLNIFSGIADISDSFNSHLASEILKLISKALDTVKDAVTNKLEYYEELAKTKGNVNNKRDTIDNKDIIIDKV